MAKTGITVFVKYLEQTRSKRTAVSKLLRIKNGVLATAMTIATLFSKKVHNLSHGYGEKFFFPHIQRRVKQSRTVISSENCCAIDVFESVFLQVENKLGRVHSSRSWSTLYVTRTVDSVRRLTQKLRA